MHQQRSKVTMNKINRSSLATIVVYLMFLFAVDEAYAEGLAATFGPSEQNTDRPGMNYKNFDLRTTDQSICANRCAKDEKCRAWTYVKPGVQGPRARCWLKSGVPPAVANNCCISAVKSAVKSEGMSVVLLCEPLSFASTSP
jgi:hypothetical protein